MPPYLHTFICARTKLSKVRLVATFILIASSFTLFGCSSVHQSSDTSKKEQDNTSTLATRHPDDQIKELLEAEFTLQREGPSQAFLPFYKITQKTKDKALAERLVHIAVASQNNTNIEKSTDLLISIFPNDEQAYALKLQMLMQSNRPNDASAVIVTALKKGISIKFLPLFIDKNIRNNDLMNTVAATLKQLPNEDHKNLFIKASDARVQFSSGNYQSAIQTSSELLANKNTTDTEPLFLILAYSQDQLGNKNTAISSIEKGRARFPQSTRLLTPLLEFLVQSKQLDKASKTYKEAKLNHVDRIQAGINFSNTLLSNGYPGAALSTLNQLPEKQYGFEDQIHYLIANALSDLGKKGQAIKEMNKVTGILNTHATDQIALWLYDEDQEKQINNMVLQRTSREHIPEVVTAICRLHEEKKHNDLSLELLRKTLQIYPQSDALRYRKALLEDTMGNWKNTIVELKFLLHKSPQNTQYLNALGYTLLTHTHDTTKAMSYIEKAYQQDPEDPAIVDSLGWGFFLQDKLSRASFYLKKAWDILNDAEIGAHYGEVLWQQKANQQAIDIWKEALNNNPNNTLLLETIKRLHPSLLENNQSEIKDN